MKTMFMDQLINVSLSLSLSLSGKNFVNKCCSSLLQRILAPFNMTGRIEKSLCIKYSNIESAWKGFVADARCILKTNQIHENIWNNKIKRTNFFPQIKSLPEVQFRNSWQLRIAGLNSKQNHLKVRITFIPSFYSFVVM